MLKIRALNSFKKGLKRAKKRGLNIDKLTSIVNIIASQELLPEEYRDHKLEVSKKYKGMRECHVQPDWLLIYKIEKEELVLILVDTGTHSDLF